jgi:hypothetical protein
VKNPDDRFISSPVKYSERYKRLLDMAMLRLPGAEIGSANGPRPGSWRVRSPVLGPSGSADYRTSHQSQFEVASGDAHDGRCPGTGQQQSRISCLRINRNAARRWKHQIPCAGRRPKAEIAPRTRITVAFFSGRPSHGIRHPVFRGKTLPRKPVLHPQVKMPAMVADATRD